MSDLRQNVLYVTTDGLYVHHELECVKVERGDETVLRIPIHHLSGITIMARASVSPSLLQKCMHGGIPVTFLTPRGRLLGRLDSAGAGNVLLRREQFRKADSTEFKTNIARRIVAGKLQNARLNLMRSARDADDEEDSGALRTASDGIAKHLELLENAPDVDAIRGHEGIAARHYFSVFDRSLRAQHEAFTFDVRSRRPPRSRANALLSFAYSLLTNDCVGACQAAGLDPFVGFLHDVRPGRPALALDLVEEFRAFADRFVWTLINRKQIQQSDVESRPGSVFSLTDGGRKQFLKAFQERKQDEITYPLLNVACRVGDLPFYQARVLARTIRGELRDYIPFIWK